MCIANKLSPEYVYCNPENRFEEPYFVEYPVYNIDYQELPLIGAPDWPDPNVLAADWEDTRQDAIDADEELDYWLEQEQALLEQRVAFENELAELYEHLRANERLPDSSDDDTVSYVTTNYEPTSQSDNDDDEDYVPPNVRRRLFED